MRYKYFLLCDDLFEAGVSGERILAGNLRLALDDRWQELPPERVLVLFDDISLPVGRLRIRADGSAGGHNGIKSIIGGLNSQSFPRVKIGVGAKPHPDYDLADWVLSNFTGPEDKLITEAAARAAAAAHWVFRCSVGQTTVTPSTVPSASSSAAIRSANVVLPAPGVATARKSRGLVRM